MEFSKTDWQEKKEVFHFPLDSVKAVDFSPDGRYVLAANYSQVFILDRISGEPVRHVAYLDNSPSNQALFSPSGLHT